MSLVIKRTSTTLFGMIDELVLLDIFLIYSDFVINPYINWIHVWVIFNFLNLVYGHGYVYINLNFIFIFIPL